MLIKSFARCRGKFPDEESAKGTPGKNFSAYLQGRIQASGISILQVEDSSIEHSFRCLVNQRQFWVSVYFTEDEDGNEPWWEVEFHRHNGSFLEPFKGTPREEMRELAETIDRALKGSGKISSVRWYQNPLGDPEEDYSFSPDSFEDLSRQRPSARNKTAFKAYLKATTLYSVKVFPVVFIFCVVAFVANSMILRSSHTGELIRILLGKLVAVVIALWMGLNGFGVIWGILSGGMNSKKKPGGMDFPRKNGHLR